jgi:hypothetical protein
MEMLQGKSLCSYLKQAKMSIYFIYKTREQEGGTGPVWGVGTSRRGKKLGKEHGWVNMGQILCTHVCKWKNDTVETIPGMGRWRIKENGGGGEFNYDIFDIL